MVEALKPTRDKDDKVHADLSRKSNEFVNPDVLLYHAGRIAEAYQKKKEASALHSKARRMFKSTGVSMEVFDLVERLAEHDDPEQSIDKFIREMLHIGAAFGVVPELKQVDLFDGVDSRISEIEKAFRSGRNRALLGKWPDEEAYHANTDLWNEHNRGWNEGQEVHQNTFLANNKQQADEDAAKIAAAADKAKKREEQLAKAKASNEPPKTADGETEQ